MRQIVVPTPEDCWSAIRAKAPAADFVYAVRTTGIYCRSGCASRLPKRRNVEFFPGSVEAEAAGYRPCLRCRPGSDRSSGRGRLVAICRALEYETPEPKLSELAARFGMSASYLQRWFTRQLAVSPKKYAESARRRRLLAELPGANSVADAAFAVGFGAVSRAYDAVRGSGVTLGQRRRGPNTSRDQAIEVAGAPCALGAVAIAIGSGGIWAVELADTVGQATRSLRDRFPGSECGRSEMAENSLSAICDFVAEPAAALQLPLKIRGTAFQQRVWQALMAVPLGQKVSYSQLAERLGAPKSARAVARACASNQHAILIPCHRVVRADETLSGYRWGVERKRALLAGERGCE